MNQKRDLSKIFIVVTILIFLLLGIFFLRIRGRAPVTQEEQGKPLTGQPTVIPTTAVVANSLLVLVSPQSVKVGENVRVVVAFYAPNSIISGSDVRLSYDPEFFSTTYDIDPPAGGGYFSSMPRRELNTSLGIVKVTAFGGKNQKTLSPATIFSLNLTTKKATSNVAQATSNVAQAGTTEIKLDYQPGTTNLSTLVEKGTSKNILVSVKNAVVEIKL